MRRLAWLVLAGAFACKPSSERADTTTRAGAVSVPSTRAAPATPRVAARPHPIDSIFAGYEQKLPEPETLSQANGATLKCPHHGYQTYNWLDALGQKLPLDRPADSARLVPWLRHTDPCLRQIALDAVLPKIGYDRDKLSLPSMHDPEHHQYHDIFVSLRNYLNDKGARYPAKLFGGLMLDVRAGDFERLLVGTWRQEIGKSHNFQYVVVIEAKAITTTLRSTRDKPPWPDRTWTEAITKLEVDERSQFVLTLERAGGGDPQPHRYWLVADDVVWFDGGMPNNWRKLRRD